MVADAAYATCLRLARQHYENFPVASRLVPRAVRPHIAAVYAFARLADDFADEGRRSSDARLALLDDWRSRLGDAVAGRVRQDGSDAAHVFTALGETIRTCDLDESLLGDLLSAFRQDVLVQRYETWAEVIDYCRRSANPVGRLVLQISGYRDPRIQPSSDALCTALQLTNFWQDIELDWRKGRLYVPLDLARSAGAEEADLGRRRISAAWRGVLSTAATRTRALFSDGRHVVDAVRGRLRWELRATWHGGLRILDRTEAAGFDVFRRRPTLGWTDAALILGRALTWSRAHGSPRR